MLHIQLAQRAATRKRFRQLLHIQLARAAAQRKHFPNCYVFARFWCKTGAPLVGSTLHPQGPSGLDTENASLPPFIQEAHLWTKRKHFLQLLHIQLARAAALRKPFRQLLHIQRQRQRLDNPIRKFGVSEEKA